MNKRKFIRIIPRLDVKNGLLIKGINLEGLRVLGDPFAYAHFYAENLADEICYIDSVSSLYGTNNLIKFIKKTSNIKIPFMVGGGLNSIEQISKVLNSGADRVCINTASITNPKLIYNAARKFGSSTIAVNIQYTAVNRTRFVVHSNGRELTNLNPLQWAKKMEEMGAGEIVLTSVLNEGLFKGFDLPTIKKISNNLKIPVIAHGGCGSEKDVYDVVRKTQVSGVMISGLLHYGIINKLNFKKKRIGNLEFYNSKERKLLPIKNYIKSIKKKLHQKNINVRFQ